MADSEFEQFTFRQPITLFPKVVDPYTLVHDVLVDDETPPGDEQQEAQLIPCYSSSTRRSRFSTSMDVNDEPRSESRSGKDNNPPSPWSPSPPQSETNLGTGSNDSISSVGGRRRRKLPEIPKNRKAARQLSLADELGAVLQSSRVGTPDFMIGGITRPLPLLKTLHLTEDNSPDSDRFHSTDVDSGNSTAHSPDLLKSGSPLQYPGSFTPVSASSSSDHMVQIELLDPTHRGLHKFVPRHRDEVEIEIGDPIYVNNEAEDLWCEGINLRTGLQGIFPSAHVVDVEYTDFDPSEPKVRRERFILGYLGSVETLAHKGNSVLCQAVKKIRSKDYTPHSCILEISDTGIRMVDRKKPKRKEVGCHDYFYSLKNVSFCAFHPRDQRYMGFITKHPTCDRFACHVFIGCESTRPVAEAVGRAFQRFYQKFVETAFPVEDIYIE